MCIKKDVPSRLRVLVGLPVTSTLQRLFKKTKYTPHPIPTELTGMFDRIPYSNFHVEIPLSNMFTLFAMVVVKSHSQVSYWKDDLLLLTTSFYFYKRFGEPIVVYKRFFCEDIKRSPRFTNLSCVRP